ncbi:ankyrin repeat domain-containing protein 53 [Tamandua tetradactyla]|uniref:ankyrin repeat domain-containing protein 53 n=1 Tax=Tamandua tetradactyla TaxID=48850 RepID=UPI0040543B53
MMPETVGLGGGGWGAIGSGEAGGVGPPEPRGGSAREGARALPLELGRRPAPRGPGRRLSPIRTPNAGEAAASSGGAARGSRRASQVSPEPSSSPRHGLCGRARGEGRGAGSCRPSGRMQAAEKDPSKACGNGSVSSPKECDRAAIGSGYELFAAAVGNVEWLRFCLKPGRREIVADGKGFTAIHFAAQQGKLACLQVLVEEYKFPVDLPTHSGQTPLHLIIHRANKTMALPCLRYLTEKKAVLNPQTCNGYTPLHLAAHEGLLACVKFLVQSGANVHAQDAMGRKPIDICKIWNHRACARFLKDAMWKRDKKDFAHEMEKLKKLKHQLALMERSYLIQQQKEYRGLAEANFKKWLHSKQLPPGQLLPLNTEQKPSALPRAFQSFLQGRQRRQGRPTLQPMEGLPPISRPPTLLRPSRWNFSNNPARFPITQIGCPLGIRLGVQPDPSHEQDFLGFVQVKPDGRGGALLCTADGHQVAPALRLPLEVMVHELHPSLRWSRMQAAQGFCPVSMRHVPRKRHLGDDTFWTDTLAMSLRETFDEAFLAALRAHQGLPALPSPKICP